MVLSPLQTPAPLLSFLLRSCFLLFPSFSLSLYLYLFFSIFCDFSHLLCLSISSFSCSQNRTRSPDLPTRHSGGRRVVDSALLQASRRSLLRHNPLDRFDPFLGRSLRPPTSSVAALLSLFRHTSNTKEVCPVFLPGSEVDAHAAISPLGLP